MKYIFLFAFISAGPSAYSKAFCTPFKVHRYAQLPSSAKILVPEILPEGWENRVAEQIGRIKTQEEFPPIYQLWLKQNPQLYSDRERYEWLHCLLHYVSMDTNKNGIPDWTAIVDHLPTRVLYPNDPDMDGDGVPNVLDPAPLNAKITGPPAHGRIPAHLRISPKKSPLTARLQEQLFNEFGIIAIEHTDQHSPAVLKEFLFLLRNGFAPGTVAQLKTVRYIYAFSGHDPEQNVASFHFAAQALSVGGIQAYPQAQLSAQERIDLLAALAHEMGHAFLMDKLSVEEAAKVATRFGGWPAAVSKELKGSFYSPFFFMLHPLLHIDAAHATGNNIINTSEQWRRRGIVSGYSLTNPHEWFAETFAAGILNRMGERHLLGSTWKNFLIKKDPHSSPRYWINYNNVPRGFRQWLSAQMNQP